MWPFQVYDELLYYGDCLFLGRFWCYFLERRSIFLTIFLMVQIGLSRASFLVRPGLYVADIEWLLVLFSKFLVG